MKGSYHRRLDNKNKPKWQVEISYTKDEGNEEIVINRDNLESYSDAINWLANKLRTLPDDVNPTININQYHE